MSKIARTYIERPTIFSGNRPLPLQRLLASNWSQSGESTMYIRQRFGLFARRWRLHATVGMKTWTKLIFVSTWPDIQVSLQLSAGLLALAVDESRLFI